MLKALDTLFARILLSFILIIVLTMSVSIFMEYLSTVNKMPDLLTEVRSKNAAIQITEAYSREGNWSFLNQDFFLYNSTGGSSSEEPLLRYIVKDLSGRTVYNSFTLITERIDVPLREGNSVELVDGERGEVIGTLAVYISSLFVEREADQYIQSVFGSRVLQSLILLVLAFLLSVVLSRMISRPVRELTSAAEQIAEKGDSSPLPESNKGELGRMTGAFNAMVRSLYHQKELRRILIRNVSHDIATPLNVVRLEARGLLDNLSPVEEGAGRIIREVDKLKNYVNDLNWLAETDSGEYRLAKQSCHLEDLVRSEVARWENQAAAAGLELRILDGDENIPPIEIDPVRISEALGNLIENGIKYSRIGGFVEVSVLREKDFLVISVSDRGRGISEEDIHRVFERFYRGRELQTGGVEGRGLGLAIVSQIVQLHGGKAEVTSEAGKGSLFRISLPM